MSQTVDERKTAYEIETELGGSGPNRTGFGGRPELINFYVASGDDVSALPVLDEMTIAALRCGKIIPVVTIAGEMPKTAVADVMVSETEVKFHVGNSHFVYTIETKIWAKQQSM